MLCVCGGQTMVTETRTLAKVVCRRRKCLMCGKNLYTEEVQTNGKLFIEIKRRMKERKKCVSISAKAIR